MADDADDDDDLDAWYLEDEWMRAAALSSTSSASLELAEFALWPTSSEAPSEAESEATTNASNSVFGSVAMVSHENLQIKL